MSDKLINQSKIYETLLTNKSDSYTDIQLALEITAEFIKSRKRILYGGMAIDFALKKKGHEGIYTDDIIPDYDFYTPYSVEDSNELSLLLTDAGLPNISSINAFHQTTRKVRVNFENVADVSYVPTTQYEKIPTSVYQGFTFVNPLYQMIDLHRSSAFLFENPPLEPINHRIVKDMTRYRSLAEYYPIIANIEPNLELDEIKLPVGDVIGGLLSYAFYYKLSPIPEAIPMTLNGQMVKFPSKYSDIVKPIIITDDFQKILEFYTNLKKGGKAKKSKTSKEKGKKSKNKDKSKKSKGKKSKDNKDKRNPKKEDKIIYKNKLLGIIPRSIEINQLTIFDNKGSVLSVSDNGYKVPTVQYTLMYCLFMYHQSEDSRYLEFYKSIKLMIQHMDKKYKELVDVEPDEAKELLSTPFFLNTGRYGDYNWGEMYLIRIRDKYNQINDIKVQRNTPKNFYPSNRGRKWDNFDYSLFAINGEEVSPFESLELFSE